MAETGNDGSSSSGANQQQNPNPPASNAENASNVSTTIVTQALVHAPSTGPVSTQSMRSALGN